MPVSGTIVPTTEPVRIGGGAPIGRDPLHFPGLIDEAQIFNRALTACEVAVNALVQCDTTPPVVTPTVSGTLGNNGWYRSNVTVSWSVTDPESSVTSTSGCGTTVLTADTAGTTLTCTATTAGGTASNSVTVKIDKTDPLINSSRSVEPNTNGWNNTGVTVSYTASDALSGIDAGASNLGADVLSSEGANQSATGTVVDEAGNSASATESPINIDLTDPLISSSRSVGPNANGRNNTGVTVSYAASDALSGIDAGASDFGADVLSSEGANQSATGTVVDEAGNSASATESPINIDLTDPLISSSRSVGPNANGWNNTGVTVSYAASDALSGIDAGASDFGADVLSSEGANQSATGTVVDEAGNSASATESPINIDLTDPILSLPPSVIKEATSPAGAAHSYPASASDNLDPAPPFSCVSPSGSTFPVGTTPPGATVVTAVNCTATDQADNSTSGSFTVTVQDTTPPALTIPAPITVECNAAGGVPTSDAEIQAWLASPSATDIVDPSPTITDNAPGFCNLGVTTVTFTATDAVGNDTSLSPNPPKDTDGRREGSGRGWVRELQGRWPGVLG